MGTKRSFLSPLLLLRWAFKTVEKGLTPPLVFFPDSAKCNRPQKKNSRGGQTDQNMHIETIKGSALVIGSQKCISFAVFAIKWAFYTDTVMAVGLLQC